MADSPSKRRKTSPTTSVPVDASNTPSRIPIPSQSSRNTPSRRPSFASPTKASLARHNPQLLNRPSSSGANSVRPGSRGRDLQDVFAQALAENRGRLGDSQMGQRDGSESATTTQENDPPTEVLIAQSQGQKERATTPKARSRDLPGSLSAKPRRMSRSPSKRPERSLFEHPSQLAAMELNDDANPFQKKGLRRSPPLASQKSQPSQAEPFLEDVIDNPFKKTGLRRSPIASQKVGERLEESNVQKELSIEIKRSGLRRSPISSQPIETLESNVQQQTRLGIQKGGLRRSPIASQTLEINENNAQHQTRRDLSKVGLRRSPISSTPSEITEPAYEGDSQHQTQHEIRKGGLRRSPIGSQTANFLDESNSEAKEPVHIQPEVKRAEDSSPVSPVIVEPAPETGVRAEPPVATQLEPEFQESTTPKDPLPTRSLQEVLPEKPSRGSDSVDRPAQSATQELLKATAGKEQDVKRKSPKIAKAPALSIVEEIMNPFITRRYDEPELPPTPSQLGIPDPVVTTPPSGIHDTPSKRARRRKGLSDKLKSSPLKPKNPRPEHDSNERLPKPRDERPPQKLPVPKEPPQRRRSSRFIAPVDPHAEKKKERDELLRQLQQLQADVALANQENERLRIISEVKKPMGRASNASELLAMLLRSTASEPASPSVPKQVSVLKSMEAFLPFRPRRKAVVLPVSDKPLPSHLPIALDDPLPYLQAFSPLAYTSTITLMPSNPPASDSSPQAAEHLMQKYVINASHPSGLFAARLSMVADSSLLAINSIDVLRLDMSAEVELGTFIRARAQASGALAKDITVICWAMARWVEVSIQRARFWCAVEKEFGSSQARKVIMQKKRKRKRQAVDEDKDEDEDEEGENIAWTRRQLLPNIGRTNTELTSDDVELRLEWKIRFDYTGEVESVLAADARIPGGWQDLDDRHSLAKVPEIFNRLVKERGPMSAVRALVGLMLG